LNYKLIIDDIVLLATIRISLLHCPRIYCVVPRMWKIYRMLPRVSICYLLCILTKIFQKCS